MTDTEIQQISYMRQRAAEFGLQHEIDKSFLEYLDAGDTIAEAVRCALYDWDIV